jgi:hypothetical protein
MSRPNFVVVKSSGGAVEAERQPEKETCDICFCHSFHLEDCDCSCKCGCKCRCHCKCHVHESRWHCNPNPHLIPVKLDAINGQEVSLEVFTGGQWYNLAFLSHNIKEGVTIHLMPHSKRAHKQLEQGGIAMEPYSPPFGVGLKKVVVTKG